MDNRKLVYQYLSEKCIDATIIATSNTTSDGEYFLMDDRGTRYMLRVLDDIIFNYRDEIVYDLSDLNYNDDEDYASNNPCDNTGYCVGIQCTDWFKCKGRN